jgi:hypothetical protein
VPLGQGRLQTGCHAAEAGSRPGAADQAHQGIAQRRFLFGFSSFAARGRWLKEGTSVSLAIASSVKYSKSGKQRGRRVVRARGVRAFEVAPQEGCQFEHLFAVKKLIDQIGLAAAQRSLAALAKLTT